MTQEVFDCAKTSEVGFTEASWPDGFDAEVDATAVTKQTAELASVAISAAVWANRGCRTLDSRDPIAPGVDPDATRLRTARMNG